MGFINPGRNEKLKTIGSKNEKMKEETESAQN
jgi:hypothetical protein